MTSGGKPSNRIISDLICGATLLSKPWRYQIDNLSILPMERTMPVISSASSNCSPIKARMRSSQIWLA